MTMTMKMIFLDAWDNMLDKYDLKNNNWLQRQFELRENWVLVYGRKTFCADMSITQRSESMNSQTKRYITYIIMNCYIFFVTFKGWLMIDVLKS